MVVKPVALDAWRDELEQVQDRLGELFVRPEPRRQAGLYLEALLSSTERKNGWQLAEQIGDARPWRTQAVLSQALWSQDKARALCRSYVIEHLGAPDGVLVVDETGFVTKGTRSVGVARQYSGTAGRVENGQIGVFRTRGKSPGKANVLIMQAKPAGRILCHRRWCRTTRKLSRTSKKNSEPNTWRNYRKSVSSQPILFSTCWRSQQPIANLPYMSAC